MAVAPRYWAAKGSYGASALGLQIVRIDETSWESPMEIEYMAFILMTDDTNFSKQVKARRFGVSSCSPSDKFCVFRRWNRGTSPVVWGNWITRCQRKRIGNISNNRHWFDTEKRNSPTVLGNMSNKHSTNGLHNRGPNLDSKSITKGFWHDVF